jgi:NAD(P)-dependent dehydrogenase (short-subunit alcohol dehydrogenase family)
MARFSTANRVRPGFGADRVAALTGAASGIGRELALKLGRAGVRLALADLDAPGLSSVVTAIRAGGGVAEGRVLDVTDAAKVDAWAEATVRRFGAVHMIWNVAGIINAGDVVRSSLAEIEHVVAVDFWGVVHGTKAFLPHIIEAGGGHVVNVSSAFGLISAPGYGSYNAAKFAVRGWSDALRQEMRLSGTDVQVSCVYPGGVRTPIMAHSTSAAGPRDARWRREVFESRVARTDPDHAAEVILRGVHAGRARIMVGADARVADVLARVTGTGYERISEVLHHGQAGDLRRWLTGASSQWVRQVLR